MRKGSPRLLAQLVEHGHERTSVSRRYLPGLRAKLRPLSFEGNLEVVCGNDRERARWVELAAVSNNQLDVDLEVVHRLVLPGAELRRHSAEVHGVLNLVQVPAYTRQLRNIAINAASTHVGHPSLIGSTGRSKIAAFSTLLRPAKIRSHRFVSTFCDPADEVAVDGGAGGGGGGAASFALPLALGVTKLKNGSLAAGFSLARCPLVSFTRGTAGADGFEEFPARSTTRTLVVTAGVRSRSDVVSNKGVEGRDGFLSTGGGTEGVLGLVSLSVVLPIFMLATGAGEADADVDDGGPLNGGGAGALGA